MASVVSAGAVVVGPVQTPPHAPQQPQHRQGHHRYRKPRQQLGLDRQPAGLARFGRVSHQPDDVVDDRRERQAFDCLLQAQLQLRAPAHGCQQRLVLALALDVHAGRAQRTYLRHPRRQVVQSARHRRAGVDRGIESAPYELFDGLNARQLGLAQLADAGQHQDVTGMAGTDAKLTSRQIAFDPGRKARQLLQQGFAIAIGGNAASQIGERV